MSDIEIKAKDQKNMIVVGVVAGVLIIYSAFFAHELPYSITQYMGYSFIKLILFAIIAVVTYSSPVIGIALLIALLSTFQYFYVQKAFRKNLSKMNSDALINAKQKARRLGRKIKETIKDKTEEVENAIQDDEDKKEEKIKEEIKESMASIHENYSLNGYDDNSYYIISDDSNSRQYGQQSNIVQNAGIYRSVNDIDNMQRMNNSMLRMNNKRCLRGLQMPEQSLQGMGINMGGGIDFGNKNNSNNMDIYPSFVNEIDASSFETYPNGLKGYNANQDRQF